MLKEYTVAASEAGQRLDIYCVSKLPGISRSQLQRAIKDEQITANGATVKPRYDVAAGDVVTVALEHAEAERPAEVNPQTLPLLYEDEHVWVIDKPAGVDAEYITGRAHRLDKDTTGVMVAVKDQKTLAFLQEQFKRRYVTKEYQALVFGMPSEREGRINRPLARSRSNPMRRSVDPAGKSAVTQWQILRTYNKRFSLLTLQPLTGRTHQLRVHLHWLGFPIVGDQLYTFKRQKPPAGVTRQLLHAAALTIKLPTGGRQTFEAPLPEDFQNTLSYLDNH